MITEAKYTSTGTIYAVIDGQGMDVPDDMGNRHRQMIVEWEAVGHAIQPYSAVPGEPMPYRVYKSVFIRRLTSEEAATMEAVLAAADAKLRLMFNSVEYFVSDDPLFSTLEGAVSAVLGGLRAEELLAAE